MAVEKKVIPLKFLRIEKNNLILFDGENEIRIDSNKMPSIFFKKEDAKKVGFNV